MTARGDVQVFTTAVVCYLFLGGTGAGALVVLSALECLRLRELYSHRSTLDVRPLSSEVRETQTVRIRSRLFHNFVLPDDVFTCGWPLCFALLALGIACLLVDIGRPDRLLNLVSSFHPSSLSLGAYALVIALACAGFFLMCALFDTVRLRKWIVFALAFVGIVSGVVVAVYTGVLLQGLASVLFYQTPFLPIVFTISSLSCGIACVFLAAVFVESRWPFSFVLVRLSRIDGILIMLEALCLALYVSTMLINKEGGWDSAYALVAGDMAWIFWCGLVIVGLVVPFVLELFVTHSNSRTQFLWIAACVFVGGFILRWCMAGAADFDITQTASMLYGLGISGN